MLKKPTYKRWWITILFDNLYSKEMGGIFCISHFIHLASAYITFCIWLWIIMFQGIHYAWMWYVIAVNFIGFSVNPLPWLYRFFRRAWLKKYHPEGVYGYGTIDGLSEEQFNINIENNLYK